MYYYKYIDSNSYTASNLIPTDISKLIEITEEEYNAYIQSLAPTEEDIRAEKEAQLQALLKELYPEQEKEILDNLEQTN